MDLQRKVSCANRVSDSFSVPSFDLRRSSTSVESAFGADDIARLAVRRADSGHSAARQKLQAGDWRVVLQSVKVLATPKPLPSFSRAATDLTKGTVESCSPFAVIMCQCQWGRSSLSGPYNRLLRVSQTVLFAFYGTMVFT